MNSSQLEHNIAIINLSKLKIEEDEIINR